MEYYIIFMNFLYDVIVGSPDVCFAVAWLLPAAIGAAAMIGGAAGVSSTNSANKTNIKLAREQREWEEKMINQQNEYNTPENQMARYQQAGINPYTAIGQISSGSQTTAGGGQSAATVQPLPFQGITDNILNSIMTYSQAQQLESQTKAQNIENAYNQAVLLERIEGNKAMFKKNSLEYNLFKDTYKNLVAQSDTMTSAMELDRKMLLEDLRIKRMQATIAESFGYNMSERSYQLLGQELEKGVLQIKGLALENRLTDKRFDEIVQGIAESVARVGNIKADTGLKTLSFAIQRAMFPYMLENAQIDVRRNQVGYQNDKASLKRNKFGYYRDFIGATGDFFDTIRKGKQAFFGFNAKLPVFGSFGIGF